MANELSNLKPSPGSRKKPLRVGRGEGSGKGKTAGRGTKGQHARSTVKRGFEGGQMPLARRLPKRGFTNIFKKDYATVRLDLIAARFAAGDVVDVDALRAKGFVETSDGLRVLQGVGSRIELGPADPAPPAALVGRLVLIHRGRSQPGGRP